MSNKVMSQAENKPADELGAEDMVDDEDWGDVDKSYYANKGVK